MIKIFLSSHTYYISKRLRKVPRYTYIAIPLKNIWNRRLMREVKIAIKHRVLSYSGSIIIRFFVLLQHQAVAAG